MEPPVQALQRNPGNKTGAEFLAVNLHWLMQISIGNHVFISPAGLYGGPFEEMLAAR